MAGDGCCPALCASAADADCPPAGVLELAAPSLSVTEGGTVQVVVRRVGGSRGSAPFTLLATGGTASVGAHYAFAGGSSAFADGDAADRAYALSTVDDAVRGDRTVVLGLSAGTGTTLGTVRSTTVTIEDDDVCLLPDVPDAAADPGALEVYVTQPVITAA
ncbi:MAG: hypothetical protein HZB37_10445, partial [Planctomycetes bacterium]|nr:hypothetical protein [Planctomycetota bacterium]